MFLDPKCEYQIDDEYRYENIEYLDPDIDESVEPEEHHIGYETNGNFDDPGLERLQNEVKENIPWNALCKVFLFLALSFTFVVKVLSIVITELKLFQHKLKLCIENSCAIKTKVKTLSKRNFMLKRALKSEEAKYSKCQLEKKSLMQSISRMFYPDQINIFIKNLKRTKKWSDETILRSLQTKFACGKRGYNFLRVNGFPLPSIRILQKRLQGINFNPGSWNDVFVFLKEKVKSFTKCERECVLIVDGMSIVEGK